MRARLLAALLGLGCAAAAVAEPLTIVGRWAQDDTAGVTLRISAGKLAWRLADRTPPACTQAYVLVPERPGTVYRDGRGTKFVAGAKGSFPTYLLQLEAGNCPDAHGAARISFPLPYDTRHMEFVVYEGGKPVSARRFHRLK